MNVNILIIFIVYCVSRDVSGDENEIETTCNINGKKALQYVSEKFLSFTIDPAVLLAGVSLSENSLRLAKQLSPAFIRIAGPSTPFVKYFDKDDRLPSYLSEDGNNVVISPSMWFGINEWLKLANLVPVFGLNDADTTRGVWNPKATLPLLEISDKLNVSCYWQLGYDSSNKNETRYMQDLNILNYILAAFPGRNETWKIVGSDISHISSENTESMLDEVEETVTAVMWESSGVKENSFPENGMASKFLQKSHRPNVKIWTTAPKSKGPVTFSSTMMWAKQLGDAAKMGYDVIFRQPRIHELFSDTPAYWFSLLHKKLMGSNVLDAKAITSINGTKIYAHCTRKQNSYVRRGAMTVMIVNDNDGKYKVKVKLGTSLPEKSMEVQTYLLRSLGMNSTVVSLNGRLLTQDILQKNFPFEPKIRRSKTPSYVLLAVPPHSIGFFVLPGARIPVCIDEEKEMDLLLEEMEVNQNMPLSEEILNLESRTTFGKNHVLEELAQKMKQEMKSDQQYYSSLPLLSRIDHLKEKEEFQQKKIDDRGRRLFIDRVNLAERQKKHLDFQKKRDELRKFLLDKAKTTMNEPIIESKSKYIELTSAEAEKILIERAKQRAARRNIVFTDEELIALIKKASKKSNKGKSESSMRSRQKRYINMQLLDRTIHSDPNSEKNSLNMDNDNFENFHEEISKNGLKRSVLKQTEIHPGKSGTMKGNIEGHLKTHEDNNRSKRALDIDSKLSEYKMKLAERSRKWDEKRNELLGNTEAIRDNFKEKLQNFQNNKRFTRDLKMSPILSKHKMKLAERSKKWDAKRDELLENTEIRRENIKEKFRELKNNRRFRRDLNMDKRIAQLKMRLAESNRKWEERRKELQGNTETVRKNIEGKLEELRTKRFRRDLDTDTKLTEYKMKLAERTKKWEEKRDELLGNTETMRDNIKGKLEELRNKKRFTRDLNMNSKKSQYKLNLAERSNKWDEKRNNLLQNSKTTKESIKEKLRQLKNNKRFRRDINMDLLDTNTRGQKKGEKQKISKTTINSKKLKDAEATIRKPGQTSSELVEDSLEMNNESVEQKPTKKDVFAEIADSEDLEEHAFRTTPKSKKLNFFDRKSKQDPFAVAHPTINYVEPPFKKPKKSKKKESKSEDELQFLTSSEEFSDIEDDLPCIHEYFGYETSVEDKNTKKIIQELGEVSEGGKSKTKKSKKMKTVSDDEFIRKKRGLNEINQEEVDENSEADIKNPSIRETEQNKQMIHSDYLNMPENSNHCGCSQNSVSSLENFYDQSMPPHADATGDGEASADESETVNSINPDLQGVYLPEEIRTKRDDKKITPLVSSDIGEDFKNYRKEMKKHLKDLKNLLDDDKLKFEEKKQKNKLKLLQLKKNEELELANEANDKLTRIHKEEHEHGNQLLEQLKILKTELQLKKDRIDQVLKREPAQVDTPSGPKKFNWNKSRLSTKRTMNDLENDKGEKLNILHAKDLSARIQTTHQDIKQKLAQPTNTDITEIETIKPTVILQKRSIFDTRRNVLGTYQPLSLDLRMWKPSDMLTLQKDLVNPLGISNLNPPNDLHIFQNLLGQNSLLRKRRSVAVDSPINDIANEIDDSINEIIKDRDYFPRDVKNMNEGDYEFVLPEKNKFKIIEKDGNTEMKFDHHETLRKNPKTIFDTTDDSILESVGDDTTLASKTDSEEDDETQIPWESGTQSEFETENRTENTDEQAAIKNTPKNVTNIQKIANKEEVRICKSFISNFTGFLSKIGRHIKEFMKYNMT